MIIKKLLVLLAFALTGAPCVADSLFFEDEPVQGGLPVFQVSKNFADIYKKLDGINWAGKNLDVAIESLENVNPKAHIAVTDERVVLVWGDNIVGNFPRPDANDWNGFGEITTALILKMRANDSNLRALSENEMYQVVVDSLIRGIDENGKYIFSKKVEIEEDGRLLTSVGLEGARDKYGNFRVTGIYKGAPADTAGIRQGDLIVQINGKSLPETSDMEMAQVLSGFNSGTSKIKLLTPMGEKDVVLRRATVVVADADVVHRTDPEFGAVLEIIVHKISDGAVSIVNEALARYSDVSGVVLDLRSATGDDERAAAKLAGLFIGKKPVMRIVETARDEVEVVPGADASTDVPVVMVVSDMTRGTAEAIAAAFYEYKRGVLIGTPTGGSARIATRIDLDNGGALELLNKSIKTGTGHTIDGRGVFPIVCLSNIRSSQQQQAFFLNVINNDFNVQDFNQNLDVPVADIRRGCPVITSGKDEDNLTTAVSVKILTDKKLYNNLIGE